MDDKNRTYNKPETDEQVEHHKIRGLLWLLALKKM